MKVSVDNYTTKATFIQVVASLLANTGMFLGGMVLAFPSAVLNPLVKWNALGSHVSINDGTWIASVSAIATPFGCLLGGPLVDQIGRRRGLQLTQIPAILGWLLLVMVPTPLPNMWPLLVGRVLTGVSAGLATSAAASYTTEVVTPRLRTQLVTLSPVMLSLGIFVVYLMADLFQNQWNYAAGIGCLVSAASILLISFLPESPLWLLKKNENDKALNALMTMRGTTSPHVVEEEFHCMTSHAVCKNTNISWKGMFDTACRPEVYKPFIIMNLYFLFQQLAGITVIIVYGVKFAEDTEIPNDAYVVALFIGIVRGISSFLTTWACARWGRRGPAVFAGATTAISLILLTGYLGSRHTWPEVIPWSPWIPASCILLNILASTTGYSILPWSMLGEVFPTDVRGVCSGLTSCIAYLLSFILLKFYPVIEPVVGNTAAIGFFGASAFIGTIFLYIFLPETHGKTLPEIEECFKGLRKAPSSDSSAHI